MTGVARDGAKYGTTRKRNEVKIWDTTNEVLEDMCKEKSLRDGKRMTKARAVDKAIRDLAARWCHL